MTPMITLQRRSRHLLIALLGLGLLVTATPARSEHTLVRLAREFSAQEKVKPRMLEHHGRRWMAVPITPQGWKGFHQTFCFDRKAGKEIVTLCYTPDNTVPHVALNLESDANGPKDCYLWRQNTPGYQNMYMRWTGPHTHNSDSYYPRGQYQGRGCVFPVELGEERMDFFKGKLGHKVEGGCMDWFSKTAVGTGAKDPDEKSLVHWLGFSRTTDGKRLFDRLATISREDRLPVVGVCVQNQEEFEQLSAADIFATPHAGIEDRRKGPPRAGIQHPALLGEEPIKIPRSKNVGDARSAAQLVGQKVFVPFLDGAPGELLVALRERAEARVQQGEKPVQMLWTATTVHPKFFSSPGLKNRLLFVSGPSRQAASANKRMVVSKRNSLFELSQRLEPGGDLQVDTVVVRGRVGKLNGRRVVSLGLSCDLTWSAIEQVRRRGGKIIVEHNAGIPFTPDNTIPFEEITAYYKGTERVTGAPEGFSNVVTQEVARNIAKLVRDNSVLQVGIGSVLVDVGKFISGKQQVRSEMATGWLKDLMQRGVADRAEVSFLAGNANLYRFVNRNRDRIRMAPTREINDPARVAQVPRMVAINTALEVNLLGDANATQIGGKLISSVGGQPNFTEGAIRAPGGKSIIGLRSVTKDGGSTIVLKLSGPITTPGGNVSHLVTEWGATQDLRRLDPAKRAAAIIEVAHPAHRPALIQDAVKQGLMNPEQAERLAGRINASSKKAHPALRRVIVDFWLAQGQIKPAQHARIMKAENLPQNLEAFGEIPQPRL